MKAFYLTDAGRIRDHNEDSVTILKNLNNEYLMIVADGMGGHRAGEVASSLAVAHLGKRFTETASVGSKLDAVNWLKDNINEINKAIIDYTKDYPETTGMGTTLVVAVLTKDYLIFGNIGDSVGYVVKNNKLHKVTKEHTLVNLLVSTGELTEEEAKNHPDKNIITRAMGVKEEVEADIYEYRLKKGDMILMCTDGLSNMVEDEDMFDIVKGARDIVEAVQMLIEKANSNGGRDNIGVVLAEPLADEVSAW